MSNDELNKGAPNEQNKAVTSVIAALLLATGVNVSPENAQTIGTVAALAIPFLPSAYRGIAQMVSGVYTSRSRRRK